MRGKVYRDREAKTETWYFVIELGRDLQGQRKQHKRRGFASEDAATAAMQKELVERREGTYIEPSDEPLTSYLERWLMATAPRRRVTTTNLYRSTLKRIERDLGAIPLSRLTPLAIQQTYTSMLATHKPSTIRLTHTILRAALAQAVRWQILRKNPADGVEVSRDTKGPLAHWTPEQARAFLLSTANDADHALWRLLLDSGMRVGEAQALTWTDVDLAKRLVAIRRTVTFGADHRPVIGVDTKTRSSRRVIPIAAATAFALNAHRVRQSERRQELGALWHEGDLVFDNGEGRMLARNTIDRHLQRAIAKAGVSKLTPHGLRRTMTVTWLLAGESPRVVSDRLGHRSSAFTLDVYASVTADWQSAASERVAQFLERAAGGE
jgi:integrase